jgi:hypothetical protein
MPKPPKATPNSDIDGVHREEVRNTDVAAGRGESAETLDHAQEQAVARPEYVSGRKSRDDRTR